MKTLTSRNGLPCNSIVSAIRDDRATLWLYTKCGFMAIADAELEQWWQRPDRTLQIKMLDAFDGAVLPQGPRRLQSGVAKSADGRLWFVSDAFLQMIDPAGLKQNRIPPPVYVEGVRADRKEYAVGGIVRLPARSRDIEISYTGLSYSIPQKVRFRYKLEGRDREWQDAGTRRQVSYSDLAAPRLPIPCDRIQQRWCVERSWRVIGFLDCTRLLPDRVVSHRSSCRGAGAGVGDRTGSACANSRTNSTRDSRSGSTSGRASRESCTTRSCKASMA
jgi:hypothetical protein